MMKLANGSLFLIQPRNVALNDKEVQASEAERKATLTFCTQYVDKMKEKKLTTPWAYRESPHEAQTGERLFMTGDLSKDLCYLYDLLPPDSQKDVWEQLRPHALNILV